MKNFKERLKFNPLYSGSTFKKKNKGVALILAITSLMLMVYIASEVSQDSLTEFVVNSQELTRLKTYYAARNSMQIALLRVKLFQQASKLPLPAGFSKELDQIWKFPFAWPLPISKETNSVDKDSMQKLMSESLMDASYTHTIEDEGSKIDINDLASPSKTLQKVTKQQLLNIFKNQLETDEDFRKEYQSFRFEDLVNHIIDWMSDTTTGVDGGDKRSAFSELGKDYPPNRGFRTLDELRLVPGMTDEFFKLLSPRITIYGMKAINPNNASKEVLKSLDSGMTEEAVNEAIARRDDPDKGGPFTGDGDKCLKDFKSFVESRGARLTPEFDQIPMICDKVINFRIKATGLYGAGKQAMIQNITVIVMDLSKSALQIRNFVDKEKEQTQQQQQPSGGTTGGQTSSPKPGPTSQEPLPKGPPRVVYWNEN